MKYLRRFKQHSEYNDPNIFDPIITYCFKENEVHFKSDEYDYSKDYLTFESLDDNNLFFFIGNNSNYLQTIQVSLDNGNTWEEKSSSLEGNVIFTLNKGEKALIKSTVWHQNGPDNNNYNRFNSYKKYKIYGNIASLLYGDNFQNQTSNNINRVFQRLFYQSGRLVDASNLILQINLTSYCYYGMFQFCGITNAPKLPSTTIADGCYYGMFYNCTDLLEPPQLPATTLATDCYMSMFSGCSKLRTAPKLSSLTVPTRGYRDMFGNCVSLEIPPELPATYVMHEGCCGMFMGCTSLKYAPELPATKFQTQYAYISMFKNCTSLESAPSILPSMSLVKGCYQEMFSGCTKLQVAPQLPAIILENACYYQMFYNCTSLITPPPVLGMRHVTDCCAYMFSGCTSLVTAPKLPAVNLAVRSYRAMFRECTSLVQAPELPAQTLVENCYYEMFQNCTNLNYVKARFTTSPGTYLTNWLVNVSPTGTFLKNPNAEWELSGPNGVPEGWTIQNIPVENTHTEVEYLQSTGIQAIDTGIYLDSTMSFGIRFRPINNVNQWILLVGWRVTSTNQCLINYHTTNGQVCTDRLSSGYINSPTNSINVDEWQDVKCIVEGNNVSLYLNDQLLDTKTNQSFTSTLKAYLFGANVNGTIDNRSQIVDISNFWIKDSNGNYLINLIPVRKDGIGYMYDQVTHQLFSNIGTGAFNYGEDIN